jgi:hypothetical protein
MVPVPEVESLEQLNREIRAAAEADLHRRNTGENDSCRGLGSRNAEHVGPSRRALLKGPR